MMGRRDIQDILVPLGPGGLLDRMGCQDNQGYRGTQGNREKVRPMTI